MFEAADPEVFASYVKTFGPEATVDRTASLD
jgi:phosphosulfolactate synthase (CoM biosynthesis protein A)